jgi:hypothetical protein
VRLQSAAETDPDLARVVTAWPELPAPIKAAVLALIGAAGAAPVLDSRKT